MAEKCFPTLQELRGFGIDGDIWRKFINGEIDEVNLNRNGVDVETLLTWKEQVMEIARQAANMQTYLTKAEMEAAGPQPKGSVAQVTNDPDPVNNGNYVSDGSQWLWSGVQPVSGDSIAGVYDLSDHKAAGSVIDAFASVLPSGGLTKPLVSAGNPGLLVVSEAGQIVTRSQFTPHGGVFVIYVFAWATPDIDEILVELWGYNGGNNTYSEVLPLGTLTPGINGGAFLVQFPNRNPRTWAVNVRSKTGVRIVVATIGVRRYDGEYRSGEVKISASQARMSVYRDTFIFGSKPFNFNPSVIDYSGSYLERLGSGDGIGLAAREAVIKAGTSFQVVLSSTSDKTECILHQHDNLVSSPGRLQMYVNRATPTGSRERFINLFIEGMTPAQLPPIPFEPGKRMCITLNVDVENNVEMYLGKRLWGRGIAANGVLDYPLNLLGGGLTGGPNTRIYSVSSVAYADRHVHHDAAFDSPFLIPTSFFTEKTGRYAVDFGNSIVRRWQSFEKIPPASLTKVLSALVILDRGQLTDEVEVLALDATGGSGNNLNVGDILTLESLLYDMMLPSSNVAASVAARHVGGTVETFVSWMNEKARQLGMNDSVFVNPHGLSAEGQITTPDDMLRLCKAASNYWDLQPIWGAPTRDIEIVGPNARTVSITSSVKMVGEPGVIGGKTGTLSGGVNNLMIHARTPDGTPFWGVVMKASSDANRHNGMRQCLDAALSYARGETFVP